MEIILSANKRDIKQNNKKLRKDGWVPGTIYGKSIESSPIMVKASKLQKCLQQGASKMSIEVGSEKYLASLEELQKCPTGKEFIHVSFHAFSATDKVTITVPIHLVGNAIGQTTGGILGQQLSHVDLHGLPADIPDALEVNVSNLELGSTIHIGDLPQGKYEIKDAADKVIVACNYPKIQAVEPDTTENIAPEVEQQPSASSDSEESKDAA